MPLVKCFEDLVAWQAARILNQRIYELCQSRGIAGDFELKNQLRGAALSVMTNIVEGFDCDSNVEFARFLGIARRSAVEVQSLLYSAMDARHIDQATLDAHYAQAAKAKALIGGLKKSLIQRKKT